MITIKIKKLSHCIVDLLLGLAKIAVADEILQSCVAATHSHNHYKSVNDLCK